MRIRGIAVFIFAKVLALTSPGAVASDSCHRVFQPPQLNDGIKSQVDRLRQSLLTFSKRLASHPNEYQELYKLLYEVTQHTKLSSEPQLLLPLYLWLRKFEWMYFLPQDQRHRNVLLDIIKEFMDPNFRPSSVPSDIEQIFKQVNSSVLPFKLRSLTPNIARQVQSFLKIEGQSPDILFSYIVKLIDWGVRYLNLDTPSLLAQYVSGFYSESPFSLRNLIYSDQKKEFEQISYATDTFLRRTSNYSIFKVTKESVKKHLGLSYRPITEILFAQEPKTNRFLLGIISTEPIEGGIWLSSGFWVKHLDSWYAQDNLSVTKKYKWMHGNKVRKALLKARWTKGDILPRNEKGPNYSAILKDKVLKGIIVLDASLSDFSSKLFKLYRDFLVDQGFQILKQGNNVSGVDAIEVLLKEIGSGYADFIIREGHGSVSQQNLFNLGPKNRILWAERVRGDITDSITVIASLSDENPNTFFKASFLKDSLVRYPREQILYYDSGCYSCRQLSDIIYLASHRSLVPIVSQAGADTFSGEKGSAIFEFLNGLWSRRNWGQMRDKISHEDAVLFPDDPDYQQRISGLKKIALKLDFEVTYED